jgi:HEPN domain-containing protein
MSDNTELPLDASSDWLRYAADDLEAARRAMAYPALLNVAFFHAQQCAEKALKGYLLFLGVRRVPRTHDLHRLKMLTVEAGGESPADEWIETADGYPVGVRYPDIAPPTEQEVQEAMAAAEAILQFIRELVLRHE